MRSKVFILEAEREPRLLIAVFAPTVRVSVAAVVASATTIGLQKLWNQVGTDHLFVHSCFQLVGLEMSMKCCPLRLKHDWKVQNYVKYPLKCCLLP